MFCRTRILRCNLTTTITSNNKNKDDNRVGVVGGGSGSIAKGIDFSQHHPKNFWLDNGNQTAYLHWLGDQLGFKDLEDWYHVKRSDFRRFHGTGLLNHFRNSPAQIVLHVFSDHNWKLWKFDHIPKNFWVEAENVKSYISWLADHLNFSQFEDWYKIKQSHFLETGGSALLAKYDWSPSQIVASVFPQHEFLPWKFDFPPQDIWNDPKIQREYMNWLGQQMGYTKFEDWYAIKQSDFYRHCGKTLLSRFSYSPRAAVTSILSEHSWNTWKFRGKYQTLGNEVGDPDVTAKIQDFVENTLAKECKVSNLEDWYRVSAEDVKRIGGKALVQRSGGLMGILNRAYPHHKWDWSKFPGLNRRTTQNFMKAAIKELFPNHKIIEEFLHPTLRYKESQDSLQLDVYLPDVSLAFEYQGPHHYQRSVFFSDLSDNDLAKKELCANNGITLIHARIPFPSKVFRPLEFYIAHSKVDLK